MGVGSSQVRACMGVSPLQARDLWDMRESEKEQMKLMYPLAALKIDWASEDSVEAHSLINLLENANLDLLSEEGGALAFWPWLRLRGTTAKVRFAVGGTLDEGKNQNEEDEGPATTRRRKTRNRSLSPPRHNNAPCDDMPPTSKQRSCVDVLSHHVKQQSLDASEAGGLSLARNGSDLSALDTDEAEEASSPESGHRGRKDPVDIPPLCGDLHKCTWFGAIPRCDLGNDYYNYAIQRDTFRAWRRTTCFKFHVSHHLLRKVCEGSCPFRQDLDSMQHLEISGEAQAATLRRNHSEPPGLHRRLRRIQHPPTLWPAHNPPNAYPSSLLQESNETEPPVLLVTAPPQRCRSDSPVPGVLLRRGQVLQGPEPHAPGRMVLCPQGTGCGPTGLCNATALCLVLQRTSECRVMRCASRG